MSDGTPAVAAPDLANVEEAFWQELEGGIEGKDVESEEGGSPAAHEDNDAPEEEPQEGGESTQDDNQPASEDGGDDETAEADDDAIPLDDESESEDDDPEDGAPDGEEEEEGEDSREPTEDELTVQNAATRIKNAQSLMHEATSEASQLRRERQADLERIKALEAMLEETQSSIDSGTAKSRRERRREEIQSKLSDEQKENFDLYGDMIETLLDVMEATGKSEEPKKSEDAPKEEGGPSPEQKEKINSWKDGVLEAAPDWFDLIHTDEWNQFREENPGFMTAVTNRYDNLDPAGAIQMHKGFQRWKDKQSHTQARKPKPTGSPRGKTVASAGRKAPPVKSREAIEKEAWGEFGG